MRARLYRPSVSAMQSCPAAPLWRLEPEQVSARWQEPLMGWIGADDPFSAMKDRLRFETCEQAEAFARKQGWELVIEEPNERLVSPKSYLDNFK